MQPRLPEVGIEGQRLAGRRRGLFPLVEKSQAAREVGMGVRKRRVDVDGMGEQRNGVSRAPAVLENEGEEAQRLDMVGIGFENLAIQGFRLVEPAILVAFQGRLDQAVEIDAFGHP